MTNGSLNGDTEHAQVGPPNALFASAEDEGSEAHTTVLISLSPAQLAALIDALKEDELTHRTTRIGREIRVNWRKGFNIREQTRVLTRSLPDLDEEALKHIVDAALLPDILLEYGEQLPQIITAIFGQPADAVTKEALEQVLSTLTQSRAALRGSVRQRSLDRIRRYLEHRLSTLTITTTDEVLHAA